MALERQSIEKKDFPVTRRGYDPDAVDAHLSALAGEVEELKRTTRHHAESLASAASEQVRAIVAAAETSAGEIRRQAEDQAREIKAQASLEAQATREHASAKAGDYVGKVSESTSGVIQRLEALESELATMIDSLRTGANRFNADLDLLERDVAELRSAAAPRQQVEREAEAAPAEGPTPDRDLIAEQVELRVGAVAPAEQQGVDAEAMPVLDDGNGADDAESARLVALNMALDGTSREETDRHLAQHYRLADRERLLDDVYASLEG